MDPEAQNFEYAVDHASNDLYDLGSQIRKVEKLLNRCNGPASNPPRAANLSPLAKEISKLGSQAAQASKSMHTVNSWAGSDLTNANRKQQREMSAQLEQLLNRVKEYQSAVAEKMREEKRKQTDQNTENTPLLQSSNSQLSTTTTGTYTGNGTVQTQQQVLDVLGQAEVDLHSALVEDRDQEIAEIQRGAREINSIFQDLGSLIAEQGHHIDTIEDNIANLADQTNNANTQLDRAYKHTKGRGKWTCILLSVLLVITILVGLNILE